MKENKLIIYLNKTKTIWPLQRYLSNLRELMITSQWLVPVTGQLQKKKKQNKT